MSITNYIFYLSFIHIIGFLAAVCSPAFHFLFQGSEQLFISTFHLLFFTVSLLHSQINTACFRTSLFSYFHGIACFHSLPSQKGGPSAL